MTNNFPFYCPIKESSREFQKKIYSTHFDSRLGDGVEIVSLGAESLPRPKKMVGIDTDIDDDWTQCRSLSVGRFVGRRVVVNRSRLNTLHVPRIHVQKLVANHRLNHNLQQ